MKIRKGVINFSTNSSKMQTAQVEGISGEIADEVERYQQFGFSSYPIKVENDGRGTEVIIADVGSTDHRVIIATDDRRYRPITGLPGDVMLYGIHDTPSAEHTNATQRIVLKEDGSVIVKVNNMKIELLTNGTMNITATTININGNVAFTGNLTSNGKNISDSHTHGNVTNGSGTSGQVS